MDEDEAVGFLEFGGEFGEPGIGGDSDTALKAGGDMIADGLFELVRESGGVFGRSFFAEEADSEFVNATDFVYRKDGFDGGENGPMVGDIKGRRCRDKNDVRAHLFGLANAGAGSDAKRFGFVTCGDDGGTVAMGGANSNGLAEKFGVFGLFDTREVGVEVKEQPTK